MLIYFHFRVCDDTCFVDPLGGVLVRSVALAVFSCFCCFVSHDYVPDQSFLCLNSLVYANCIYTVCEIRIDD